MPLSVQRKVLFGFATALLILAVIGGASWRSLRSASRSSDWVAHTHEVLESLAAVQGNVTDAESGERAYLLTGDRAFLSATRLAGPALDTRLAHIEEIVTDNPSQALRARALRQLVHAHLDSLLATAALHDRDPALASAQVRAGNGRRGDQLRASISRMIAIEHGLLEERKETQASDIRMAMIVIGFGFFVAALIALLATVTVGRDMREQDRLERELRATLDHVREADRAKSDFLARMSHELRTPLNSVIGFANILLKRREGLTERDAGFVERIRANGTYLLDLINDILDLSKVESGRMDLLSENVDVAALVRDILAQFGGRLHEGVRIETDVPAGLLPLRTDAAKLKQIVLNLVANAAKFTERGRVHVRVIADPESHAVLRIDVADSGVGIPADRIRAVFQAFEQAEMSTARRFGGTGLGLTIARSLADRLGFRLTVASTAGVGSTFSILTAPHAVALVQHEAVTARDAAGEATRDAAATARSDPPGPPAPPSVSGDDPDGPLVLVVDDSADARFLLTQYLVEDGCRVINASSGEEALQLALDLAPELITLDLMMPGMDGIEVLRRLKSHPTSARIPVIVISIVGSEQDGGILGAVDVVDKPIDREELAAAVRRNLAREGARVLIVEDTTDSREVIRSYLSDFPNIELRTVASGREALALLEAFHPDLLLLDLLMPEMDGATFLAHLRADRRFEHVPVIIVTGKDLAPTERRALEREALAVLAKGADMGGQLQRMVRALLRQRNTA
ncbi:MAG: multi-sensor hybrid histidine kinase [Gemmatimonadetes bacterium]|nr:multi-sensor hybrid histidine kinase [Gemmatimonadota bacterium]